MYTISDYWDGCELHFDLVQRNYSGGVIRRKQIGSLPASTDELRRQGMAIAEVLVAFARALEKLADQGLDGPTFAMMVLDVIQFVHTDTGLETFKAIMADAQVKLPAPAQLKSEMEAAERIIQSDIAIPDAYGIYRAKDGSSVHPVHGIGRNWVARRPNGSLLHEAGNVMSFRSVAEAMEALRTTNEEESS